MKLTSVANRSICMYIAHFMQAFVLSNHGVLISSLLFCFMVQFGWAFGGIVAVHLIMFNHNYSNDLMIEENVLCNFID